MSNQPITDMIEAIERFAQLQPDYPVYNVLGEEHTYGQLKADSDSLAAHIDQMGLPEKSPVVVFGGQEYEMLATFVALTKSGHAYIPIDSHSALERVSAILEVAEPSLIIAINEFPIENPAAPIMSLEQVREAYAAQNAYDLQHPVKGDDNYYIIFTSGTTGKPFFLFRLQSGLRRHLLQIWPCCLKISMLKRCQALPISTLMGKS